MGDLGGGLLYRDLTYIQSELSDCTCSGKSSASGEPYNTLWANLPYDSKMYNRRSYASSGVGLLLRDITKMQTSLGRCYCSGRWNAANNGTVLNATFVAP